MSHALSVVDTAPLVDVLLVVQSILNLTMVMSLERKITNKTK